ncbi:MAG: DUF2089 family protein [Planctomycetota bacterium]
MSNSAAPADAGSLAELPLGQLSADDLALVTEFVLCSGSLKDLAKRYGVSYPTIRSRLDGVIERLGRAVEGRPRDPLAETLAELVQRGELSATGARRVLEAARERASINENANGRPSGQPNRQPRREV